MFHITVDWSPTAGGAHTLLDYYIYRGCDDQDPVCVNSDILLATTSSFVDTSALFFLCSLISLLREKMSESHQGDEIRAFFCDKNVNFCRFSLTIKIK